MKLPTGFSVFILMITVMFFPASAGNTGMRATIQSLSNEVLENHSNKGFQILGVIELGNVSMDEHSISEFSGLVWDYDEELLYAMSDKGFVVHLKPLFDSTGLADVLLINVFILKDSSGQTLSGNFIDSEGLAAINHANGTRGDSELLIPFERIPRIDRYSTQGTYINSVPIPAFLKDVSNYKNMNTSLESVTVHHQYHIITAPEKLSRSYPVNEFQLFSMDGEKWSYTNTGKEHGSITGMTTTEKGNILALERIFPNVFMGIRFSLHHIILDKDNPRHEVLMDIGPVDGYFNENFEGIAHHRGNNFFMISDNNKTALQRSLLVYFRLTELKE